MIGDSKSLTATWPGAFESGINSAGTRWFPVATLAATGRTVAAEQALIDAQLAALPATPAPEFLCFNLGTNDVGASPGATWTTNAQYIIDAVHAKWASCQVYLMRPWKPDYLGSFQAHIDELDDTRIPDTISGRAWAHLGPDERVFLENGDDGATYIAPAPDRIHPNSAGYTLTAVGWKATVGL